MSPWNDSSSIRALPEPILNVLRCLPVGLGTMGSGKLESMSPFAVAAVIVTFVPSGTDTVMSPLCDPRL